MFISHSIREIQHILFGSLDVADLEAEGAWEIARRAAGVTRRADLCLNRAGDLVSGIRLVARFFVVVHGGDGVNPGVGVDGLGVLFISHDISIGSPGVAETLNDIERAGVRGPRNAEEIVVDAADAAGDRRV